jgi:hypothetical protein
VVEALERRALVLLHYTLDIESSRRTLILEHQYAGHSGCSEILAYYFEERQSGSVRPGDRQSDTPQRVAPTTEPTEQWQGRIGVSRLVCFIFGFMVDSRELGENRTDLRDLDAHGILLRHVDVQFCGRKIIEEITG